MQAGNRCPTAKPQIRIFNQQASFREEPISRGIHGEDTIWETLVKDLGIEKAGKKLKVSTNLPKDLHDKLQERTLLVKHLEIVIGGILMNLPDFLYMFHQTKIMGYMRKLPCK